jgi:hypothetical protein
MPMLTEQEWLAGWDCRKLYFRCVRTRIDARRNRLFMVACCRLLKSHFFDPRIANTLQVAEWLADDSAANAAMSVVQDRLFIPGAHQLENSLEAYLAAKAALAHQLWKNHYKPSIEDGKCWREYDWKSLLAQAASNTLTGDPIGILVGGHGNMAENCMFWVECAYILSKGLAESCHDETVEPEIRGPMSNLLRDIFGNPFRPVTFDPAWRTADTSGIAARMYESRDFSAMPILADALEEAGCTNPDILLHAREPGVHVRGCWVVDLVLGKS